MDLRSISYKYPALLVCQQSLLHVMQLMHLLQIQLNKYSHIFGSGVRQHYLVASVRKRHTRWLFERYVKAMQSNF